MNVDLAGKAAIVTGGSKGIGYSIADALAAAGAEVLICARNEEEVRRAAAEIEGKRGRRVVGFRCDMRSYEEVQSMVEAAVRELGRVDILINNAGVGIYAPVHEISRDSWHQVIETNLNGVYYASHEVIPHMRRHGEGWIINIASLAGKNPFAGGAAYNASKFAVVGFSEAMMMDVRHDGIRVSCIMPGSVETHFSGIPGSTPGSAEWKLQGEDIAEMVIDLLAFPPRALPSRVEMRPSQPPRK
jgi:3-oxoacyl-[acyl-carrier protein] reductase